MPNGSAADRDLTPEQYEILFGAPIDEDGGDEQVATDQHPAGTAIELYPKSAAAAEATPRRLAPWMAAATFAAAAITAAVVLAFLTGDSSPEPGVLGEIETSDPTAEADTDPVTSMVNEDDVAASDVDAAREAEAPDTDEVTGLINAAELGDGTIGSVAPEYLGAYVEAARTQLDEATVVDELVAGTPYDRAAYTTESWGDADRDCQSDRDEVLMAKSLATVTLTEDGCSVVSGLWVDSFDGSGHVDADQVTIDYLVPLQAAHRAGAWAWDAHSRAEFASDVAFPAAFQVVDAGMMVERDNQEPDGWRPPRPSTWCAYALDWTSVKTRWKLEYSTAEQEALTEMLDTCIVHDDDEVYEQIADTSVPLRMPTTTTPAG